MEIPTLQFVQDLYPQEDLDQMMRQFRTKGYVVLPDVLVRESVDHFVRELESLMYHDGLSWHIPDNTPHYIHCANTPRGYQALVPALSRTETRPFPCLHTTIVVIQKGADASYIPGWHKDREPEGMPDGAYHFPLDVFLGFYFEDMTEEHGPTVILPGSHRDVDITPSSGTVEPEPIFCRKQDALLIDQRAWHRGTARTAQGNRFLIVYGYYALPHFYSNTFKMPKAQQKAWIQAKSIRERVLFGGPFAPPGPEDLEEIARLQAEGQAAGRPQLSVRTAY